MSGFCWQQSRYFTELQNWEERQKSFSVFRAGLRQRTCQRAHSNPEISGFQCKQTSFKFWNLKIKTYQRVQQISHRRISSFPIVQCLSKLQIQWLKEDASKKQKEWLCSRWNSGGRHHFRECFIAIYHRKCTFDFGMQVCNFFPTESVNWNSTNFQKIQQMKVCYM